MEDVEFACLLGESEAIGMVRLQYVQSKPATLIVKSVDSSAGAAMIDGTVALQDIHVSPGRRRQCFYAANRARDTSYYALFCGTPCTVARGM